MDFVRGGFARAPLAPPPLPPRDAWTCRALKVARCDFQRWRVAELQLKFVVVWREGSCIYAPASLRCVLFHFAKGAFGPVGRQLCSLSKRFWRCAVAERRSRVAKRRRGHGFAWFCGFACLHWFCIVGRFCVLLLVLLVVLHRCFVGAALFAACEFHCFFGWWSWWLPRPCRRLFRLVELWAALARPWPFWAGGAAGCCGLAVAVLGWWSCCGLAVAFVGAAFVAAALPWPLSVWWSCWLLWPCRGSSFAAELYCPGDVLPWSSFAAELCGRGALCLGAAVLWSCAAVYILFWPLSFFCRAWEASRRQAPPAGACGCEACGAPGASGCRLSASGYVFPCPFF